MGKPVVPLGVAVALVVAGGAAGQQDRPAAKVTDDFVLAEPATPLPQAAARDQRLRRGDHGRDAAGR